ncbi:MAG: OmpA family protein [Alphaproteobacteria bacterium]|nr:OmpA family protein [Alphaproteobacteria bacterium]MBU1812536.1 OmpA family protein [Alphaproteobacteria bacterium]
MASAEIRPTRRTNIARRRFHSTVLTGSLLAGILAFSDQAAQAQIVIGGDDGTGVTVNLDVIDNPFGQTGRQLLMPNARTPVESGPIVLKPPASMRGKPAAAAPKLTPPASMTRAQSAPVQAAPPKPAAPAAMAPVAPPARIATPAPVAAPVATPAPMAAPAPAPKAAALPPARPEPVTPPPAAAPKAAPQPTPQVAPKAAPQVPARTEQQRTAALPPATTPPGAPAPRSGSGGAAAAVDGGFSLSFAAGNTDLNDQARSQLAGTLQRLKADEALRVQLLAYAAGDGGSSSQARRISLSRALAVRSYLIDQGIRSTRMDVRALGDTNKDGSPDRVDVRVIGR